MVRISSVWPAFGKHPVVRLGNRRNGWRTLPATCIQRLNAERLLVRIPGGPQGLGAGQYTVAILSGGNVRTGRLTVAPYLGLGAVQTGGLLFDTTNPRDVSSSNPAPGSLVTLGFRTYSGNLLGARLNYYDSAVGVNHTLVMHKGPSEGPYQWWQVTVRVSSVGTLWYGFSLLTSHGVRYLSMAGLSGAVSLLNRFPLPSGNLELSSTATTPGQTVTAAAPGETGASSLELRTAHGRLALQLVPVGQSAGGSVFHVPRHLPSAVYTAQLVNNVRGPSGNVIVRSSQQELMTVGSGPFWFDALYYNSWSPSYKRPSSAVATGKSPVIQLRGPKGLNAASLILTDASGGNPLWIPMRRTPGPDTRYSWWTARIPSVFLRRPGRLGYSFEARLGAQQVWYGDAGGSFGGPGAVSLTGPSTPYQLTVFQAGFRTPAWMHNAVVYEIMPDRFYNGDIALNQNPKVVKAPGTVGGFPQLVPIQFHHRWSSLPYDPNVVPIAGTPQYATAVKLTGNGQWSTDFFGGNLPGIEDKLDYLKTLGVTAVYLMPIFEAPSNHKYDTSNFKLVDPGFGTLADYLRLIKAAKAVGLHVILDGVFEDTGADSLYFNRYAAFPGVGAYQQAVNPLLRSPYFSWYLPNPGASPPFQYWSGVHNLPLTNSASAGWQQFVYGAYDKNAPHSATKNAVARYWLLQGASGWRLDSADNANFTPAWWTAFRTAVKATDPHAVIIGEVWNNPTNDGGTDWLTGTMFDSTMNYPFRNAILDFFRGNYNDGSVSHHAITASGLNARIMYMYTNYPRPSLAAMLNLVDSQDTMRILTVLENAPSPIGATAFQQATFRPTEAEKVVGLAKLRLVSDLQYSLPGDPMVWYGDEAGQTGYSDPLSRKTYPWGHANEGLLTHYRKLGAIRAAYPVLGTGKLLPLLAHGSVYVFARTNTGGYNMLDQSAHAPAVVVGINDRAQSSRVSVTLKGIYRPGTILINALNPSEHLTVSASGHASWTLDGFGAVIWVVEGPSPVAYLAQSASGGVSVSWLPATGAQQYRVLMRRETGGTTVIGTTSGLTFSLHGLRGRHARFITVQPISANGEAFLFPEATVVTLPAVHLAPPVLTVGTGQLLKWNAVPGALGYRVYEATPAAWHAYALAARLGPASTRWVAPSKGVYRVAAYNQDGYQASPAVSVP